MGFLGEFQKSKGGDSSKSLFYLIGRKVIKHNKTYIYKTSHLLSVIQKVPKNKE